MTTILPASNAKIKQADSIERSRRHKLNATGAKFEANDSQRVASLVVTLSKLSDFDLLAITCLKMCNERRAAQKIIAWRAINL